MTAPGKRQVVLGQELAALPLGLSRHRSRGALGGHRWLANALHWGGTLPDYQIAYVGKSALPEETARH